MGCRAKKGPLLIHAIAHDLKAPLNGILLTASLALRRAGRLLDDETRRDLEDIVAAAERGENMILDLLDLLRTSSAREPTRVVSLDHLVAGALHTLRGEISDRGTVIEAGPLVPMFGQVAKLQQVVTNLLTNAVRYSPRGSGRVAVRAWREHGGVTFEVRDNGIGIPAAYHWRIFEPFARGPLGSDDPAGTGVGLALVKRVVRQHRGRVWVESAPGRGARFFVHLPGDPSLACAKSRPDVGIAPPASVPSSAAPCPSPSC